MRSLFSLYPSAKNYETYKINHIIFKKYEIIYDPDNPVPVDDELSDRVWQAGWELFRDVGLYNNLWFDMNDKPVIISYTSTEKSIYMFYENSGGS